MSEAQPLSNLQQELLKVYASNVPEEDLLHIKRYLAKYFAFKAIGEADQIWEAKGYTNETMDQSHFRSQQAPTDKRVQTSRQ